MILSEKPDKFSRYPLAFEISVKKNEKKNEKIPSLPSSASLLSFP